MIDVSSAFAHLIRPSFVEQHQQRNLIDRLPFMLMLPRPFISFLLVLQKTAGE
jgi:hypothetical protein